MDQLVDFAKSSSGALQATMQQMVVSAPKDLTERRIRVLGDFFVAECMTLDPESFDELHAQLLPMVLQLKGNIQRAAPPGPHQPLHYSLLGQEKNWPSSSVAGPSSLPLSGPPSMISEHMPGSASTPLNMSHFLNL